MSVADMGNSETAVNTINRLIQDQDRSIAWLSRTTGIPYKRLLAEVKNCTRPMSLDTAIRSAQALGSDLPSLLIAA